MAKLTELPFNIDGPQNQSNRAPMMGDEGEAGDRGIPGYVEPFQRCGACEYFDGNSRCNKFKAQCDIDGYCPSFEEGDAGGEVEESEDGYGDMEGEEGDD